ncbi:thermonuclease family protein [Maritalea sp.]|uniref:thermonuclease family protein n=1 Tax=Maritalea sp. TaxID=2003361 RepID=UPI003EF7A1BB
MRKFIKMISVVFKLVIAVTMGAALIWMVVVLDRQKITEIKGVASVSDGDSLVINGLRIRLKGIDAPELDQKCDEKNSVWRCGVKAKSALIQLIGGQVLVCKSEGEDKYRRLLAVCYLSEKDIGKWMVTNGWAISYGDYKFDEALARRNSSGLWRGEFETPQSWRNKAR